MFIKRDQGGKASRADSRTERYSKRSPSRTGLCSGKRKDVLQGAGESLLNRGTCENGLPRRIAQAVEKYPAALFQCGLSFESKPQGPSCAAQGSGDRRGPYIIKELVSFRICFVRLVADLRRNVYSFLKTSGLLEAAD